MYIGDSYQKGEKGEERRYRLFYRGSGARMLWVYSFVCTLRVHHPLVLARHGRALD